MKTRADFTARLREVQCEHATQTEKTEQQPQRKETEPLPEAQTAYRGNTPKPHTFPPKPHNEYSFGAFKKCLNTFYFDFSNIVLTTMS